MKKLLLPLLILSLSLSLIACGDKNEPNTTTGTQGTGTGTVTTQKGGPIGPGTNAAPETTDEAAAYDLGEFVSYAEDDNFTYKIYKEGAAVSGFKGNGEAAVPDKIEGKDVKVIGRDAFRGVSNLTSITLPGSVKLIAENAFYSCTGLTSIEVPAGSTVENRAFAYATGLTEAKISDATLGSGIFYGCTALKSCTLPSSMTVIPAQTFYGCSALQYSIPSNVVEIGDEAFFSCTSLTEIVIPNGVYRIGNSAFYNCTGVTSVTLPGAPADTAVMALADEPEEDAAPAPDAGEEAEDEESEAGETPEEGTEGEEPAEGGEEAPDTSEDEPEVPAEPSAPSVDPKGLVYIGDYAFYNLSSVKEIYIPDTVVYIGTFAFAGTGITSVDIPAIVPAVSYNFNGIGEVTSKISAGAFANCLGLTEITIPNTLTDIPDLIVYGCENITTVNYNPAITKIGMGAFAKTGLATVHMPDTVTSLGASAYAGCEKLTDLTISPNVANISANAFKGCTGLTTVTISAKVTTIGESSFEGCTGLTQVIFESDAINTIFGKQSFYNCPKLMSITIPSACNTNFNTNCLGYIPDPDGEEGDKIPLEGFKMTGYIGGTFENYAKSYSADLTAYLQRTNPEKYGEDAEPVEDFLTIVGLVGYAPYADFQWDMVEPTATAAPAEDAEEATPAAPTGLIITKYTGNSAEVLIPTKFRLNEDKKISLFGIDRRVVIIGDGAFEGNTAIQSVTIPDTVEAIRKNAFKDCTGLETADLRNLASLTSVGDSAFLNTSLFKVYLPSGLTAENIGKYAFCYVQSSEGEPTVPSVGSYQYKATEYVLDADGEITVDDEGNPKTVEHTYESEAEVPADAVSVERVPVPPTIYCNGTGGSTYASDNGIESAKLPAA